MVDAIQEGINERKLDKESQEDERDMAEDVMADVDENGENIDAPRARRPRKMSEGEGDERPRRPRKSAVKKEVK